MPFRANRGKSITYAGELIKYLGIAYCFRGTTSSNPPNSPTGKYLYLIDKLRNRKITFTF